MKVEVTNASLLSEGPFDTSESQYYLYRLQDKIIYISNKTMSTFSKSYRYFR